MRLLRAYRVWLYRLRRSIRRANNSLDKVAISIDTTLEIFERQKSDKVLDN